MLIIACYLGEIFIKKFQKKAQPSITFIMGRKQEIFFLKHLNHNMTCSKIQIAHAE